MKLKNIIHDEYAQLLLFIITGDRIKNGAFERFSFKNPYFPHADNDGHDRSINYYDRICLN